MMKTEAEIREAIKTMQDACDESTRRGVPVEIFTKECLLIIALEWALGEERQGPSLDIMLDRQRRILASVRAKAETIARARRQ